MLRSAECIPAVLLTFSSWQLFWEPVRATAEYCWDYYQIVAHPTDLTAMTTRATRGDYRSVQQFSREARRLIANALRYNEVAVGVSSEVGARRSDSVRPIDSARFGGRAASPRPERRFAARRLSSSRQRTHLRSLRRRRCFVSRHNSPLRRQLRPLHLRNYALFLPPRGAFRLVLRLLLGASPAGNRRRRGGREERADRAGGFACRQGAGRFPRGRRA